MSRDASAVGVDVPLMWAVAFRLVSTALGPFWPRFLVAGFVSGQWPCGGAGFGEVAPLSGLARICGRTLEGWDHVRTTKGTKNTKVFVIWVLVVLASKVVGEVARSSFRQIPAQGLGGSGLFPRG